jgi:hypothetical protein
MEPRSLKELEKRITCVITNIPGIILRSAVANVRVRLSKCDDNAGAYVEI